MGELTVRIVTPSRELWEGSAAFVGVRTTDGQLGVLPGHEPLLASLAEGGVVEVKPADGEPVVAAVHGGFVSVDADFVRVLASVAELAGEIDTKRAQEALARAQQAVAAGDDGMEAAERRASARLRAVGAIRPDVTI